MTPLEWRPDGRDGFCADCERGRYRIARKQAAGNRPGKVWTITLDGAYVSVAYGGDEAKRIAATHRVRCE